MAANRPRGMTPDEVTDANTDRPPSKALDRYGRGTCGAQLRDTEKGERCSRPRGYGTDHVGYGYCRRHAGSTANGRKHAALERARAEVARVKREGFYGVRVAVDPEQALLEEMQRSAGAVRWLEAAIADWGRLEGLTEQMRATDPNGDRDAPAAAVDWWLNRLDGRTVPLEPDDGTAVTHRDNQTGLPTLVAIHSTEHAVGFTDTEFRAWLKVYLEERKHLAAVAKACLDAGIQERRQAVLEARAGMIRALVLAAFRLAGVTVDEERQLAIIAEATRTVADGLEST